jgi:oxygen-dependent protoporphyrinogen oxidase
MSDGPTNKTVIVGGGIAGLAAAYSLHESGADEITLIECSPHWGGKITSAQQDGFLIEGGPDSFLTQKTAAVDLCIKLGLKNQLTGSNSGKNSTTYVWSKGRLHPMPEGMMLMAPTMAVPFLRSSLISWPGKLRMGMEMFVPKASGGEDESLAGFVRRRLGTEALNKIAGPLMGGIHAADPETLSLKSTFPMFLDMEQKHGSLLRGMIKRAKPHASSSPTHGNGSAPKAPMFTSLRGGLQSLADAIVARLPQKSLRADCCVVSVQPYARQYKVVLGDGGTILADDIIFATPSYVTADLVQQIDPMLATRLRAIRYVSTATVSLGFRRGDIAHPMQGAGFIVPRSEGRNITACSWSSAKFQHRAPDDCVLLRVFIGGALAEHLAELDETSLVALALDELETIMGITATPVLAKAYRWPRANPQYELGHELRVAEIERSLAGYPGLHLAGAAYRGSGIPDCIQSGIKAAQSILEERARASDPLRDEHLPVYIGS